jgi:BirA family transcriptional regulator, biotin operon repressor / biotin---[acetyl-CoA-carboxylase] ligase
MNPLSAAATPAPEAVLASLNHAAEAVWPQLHAQWTEHWAGHGGGAPAHGFSVEVLASTASTNTELMRRARAGQAEPALLVALEQTAGRGRMGKTWVSEPGASLTFSMGLPLRPAQWAGLSLAVGVALAEALAGLLPPAQRGALQLKWPNDLWLHRAKLAGILVETAHTADGPCVVVGVGINVAAPSVPLVQAAAPAAGVAGAQLPPVPPTGLAVHVHAPPTAATVLEAVAPALLQALLAFEALGFSAFAQRFARLDALHDQALMLSDGTQGTGCGVDDTGALLVLTAQGMRTVNSNEVSVRPQGQGAAPC